MGDAMLPQCLQVFWVCTENIFLLHWSNNMCGRALQVGDDQVGGSKEGVYGRGEEHLHPCCVYSLTHTTVEKKVTDKSEG